MSTRFQRYKKRSTAIITAVQFLDEPMAIIKMQEFLSPHDLTILHGVLWVPTLEGTLAAHVGDYIVKDVKGEVYPIRKDIFEETYEVVK